MSEILDLLDMSEEEQIEWISRNCAGWCYSCCLADFAFRLRDEADDEKLMEGQIEVFIAVHYKRLPNHAKKFIRTHPAREEIRSWFGSKEAQPIHFIVAALIAKELANS